MTLTRLFHIGSRKTIHCHPVSSDHVPQVPCSISPPRATVITAYQAEVQSTKSKQLVGTLALLFSLLSPAWEKEFLAPSMACSTANACDIVCRLDRDGKLDEAPQDKKQEVATGLLRDELYEQDFAGPVSLRASKVLGPISRYRVADILPHMKLVLRASRPGLTVGILRILCNGLSTAQRFHTVEHDHTCRVGCPNEPDSLSHYGECPRLWGMFTSFWGQASVLPRRNHLLHDLITKVFLRSLQHGIEVMGFGDCMKGRIRFMTASTLAYAHGYQATCLSRRMRAILGKKFPSTEAQRQISASSQCLFQNTEKRQ